MSPLEGNQRIGIPAYFTSHAWVEARFDYAHLFETRQGRLMFRAMEPLFRLFGVLGPAVKARLSHRARPARQLIPALKSLIDSGRWT